MHLVFKEATTGLFCFSTVASLCCRMKHCLWSFTAQSTGTTVLLTPTLTLQGEEPESCPPTCVITHHWRFSSPCHMQHSFILQKSALHWLPLELPTMTSIKKKHSLILNRRFHLAMDLVVFITEHAWGPWGTEGWGGVAILSHKISHSSIL